jgi:hypothetical protein
MPAAIIDHVGHFWSRVDVRGLFDCWPWKGTVVAKGYGRARFRGTSGWAHEALGRTWAAASEGRTA